MPCDTTAHQERATDKGIPFALPPDPGYFKAAKLQGNSSYLKAGNAPAQSQHGGDARPASEGPRGDTGQEGASSQSLF
jgi:hypothetical protein